MNSTDIAVFEICLMYVFMCVCVYVCMFVSVYVRACVYVLCVGISC